MPLRLTCPCGQLVLVENSAGGQRVPCPQCRRLIVVPILQQAIVAAPPPIPASPPRAVEPGQSSAGQQGHAPPAPASLPGNAQGYFQQGPPPLKSPGNDESVKILADEAVPILEEEEYYDEDNRPRKRKKKNKKKEKLREEKRLLKITSMGLAWIYRGIICLLLSILLTVLTPLIVLAVAANAARSGTARSTEEAMASAMVLALGAEILIHLLQLATVLLCFIGSILCCWVPPKSGARGFIFTSLSLNGGAVALVFLSLVVAIFGIATRSQQAAQTGLWVSIGMIIVALVLLFVAFLLVFFFLRKFADYLDDEGTANEAMDIMRIWVFLTVGGIVGLTGGQILVIYAGCFGAAILTVGFLAWFVFYVKQWIRLLNLIAALRQKLASVYGV